jgi:hypothetical protein
MFNGLSKRSNGSVEEPIWDDVAVLCIGLMVTKVDQLRRGEKMGSNLFF